MTIASAAGLVDLLSRLPLLEPTALAELDRLQAAHSEPSALAREMVRRGWLTPYQVNQLFQGRATSLLLGSYVLLDRLGEGGMGTVFKARHRKMGRIVALKALRPERLNNADAVRRFRREIEAVARLSHPNIVLAYDADEANGVHFFTLEYINGRDLARTVREDGPLDPARACDYVRQAALGLQHAHEQGMVHRDIKPHNLMLTGKGVVKILDMGLARLVPQADGETTSTGSLTHEGTVMGTPDFMAPEQSLSTRTVDIRADLYALGCTLYFLLAGKPPFPGGTLGDKIARHLAEEPQPIEQLRPGAPPAVAAVLRKLMAKNVEDRYATPAETAAALAHALQGGSSFADGTTISTELDFSDLRQRAAAPPRRTGRHWLVPLAIAVPLVLAGILIPIVLALTRSPKPEFADSGKGNASTTAKAPRPRAILEGHTAPVRGVVFTPDGERVASGDDLGIINVWGTAHGERLASREGHKGSVLALACAADGTLASGGRDGRIAIWKRATFASERVLEPDAKRPIRGLSFERHDQGRILMSVGDDNVLAFWSVDEGKLVGSRSLPSEPASAACAPDRNFWWAIGMQDGRTLVWNHATRNQHELKGHTESVESLAFSPHGELLATAGADGILSLWDVEKGTRRATLAENLRAIHGVAISPRGNLLAAVGADGVRLWKLETRAAMIPVQAGAGELRGVAFSPDGTTLATCGTDRKVHLWNVSDLLQPAAPR
ncbi:MAG TPA: serine/threonine-protein kinase [Gemmataceae bacterium]|jgi:serine/threonine protein kinase